jgi:signal peptidase I
MEKLDLDFAALLVGLTLFTGVVWGIDRLFFAKRRRGAGIDKEPVLVEYCRSFFPVILAVLLIRSFLAEPFRIPSSSMMPTLLIGDFILVNKFAYGLRVPVINKKVVAIGEPERGDIIVFRYPGMSPDDPDKGTDFIKRVIGVPGDEITYRNKVVYVNGAPVAQREVGTYVGEHSGQDMTGSLLKVEDLPGAEHQILQRRNDAYFPMREGTWRVGEGEYFVLGDNRDNSKDSRYWGMVPEENLVGKAFLIWMNFDSKDGSFDFSRIGSTIN